jgi:hypothetical protein
MTDFFPKTPMGWDAAEAHGNREAGRVMEHPPLKSHPEQGTVDPQKGSQETRDIKWQGNYSQAKGVFRGPQVAGGPSSEKK